VDGSAWEKISQRQWSGMLHTSEKIFLGRGIPMSFSSTKVQKVRTKGPDTILLPIQGEAAEKEKPWT
jgi:hypothetical protein